MNRPVAAAVLLAALLAAGPAFADDYASMEEVGAVTPLRPKVSEQIADSFTELGDEIDAHLGILSAGVVSLRLDGRTRQAHVGFDLEGERMTLRFHSDVHLRGGVARVDARIDLSLVGRHLHLELPDFEVVPRSFAGERYVELRLPLLTGSF